MIRYRWMALWYQYFWWFLVNMKLLIQNLIVASRETMKICLKMQYSKWPRSLYFGSTVNGCMTSKDVWNFFVNQTVLIPYRLGASMETICIIFQLFWVATVKYNRVCMCYWLMYFLNIKLFNSKSAGCHPWNLEHTS